MSLDNIMRTLCKENITQKNPEVAKKMSKSRKGIASFAGKHHTEESKRKIREGHKNLTPWNKGLTGVNTGKKGRVVSEETKQKLRDANLGKHLSESTREKLSKKSKGRIWCNNGVEEKLVRDIPIGYVKGRLKLNKNK